jgi:glucosamine-phosphate N-acetyltransferase
LEGTAAHLEDVVVDENWRGEGVGQALVKRAIETAKSFNCYKIMLTCYPKTTPFYEKLGFEQHALEMRMNLIDDLYPKDEK